MLIFKKEKENDRLVRILRETFESYDADGSGCIDGNELKMLMAQLGKDMSEDMANEMISQVDQDGNGEIDFEEFIAMFKGASLIAMAELFVFLLKLPRKELSILEGVHQ